jgi:hypothetical protein
MLPVFSTDPSDSHTRVTTENRFVVSSTRPAAAAWSISAWLGLRGGLVSDRPSQVFKRSPGSRSQRLAIGQQKGSFMEKIVVSYHGADLYAWEHEGVWTVQLGAFEASSTYLDLALAELVGSSDDVHELAARLVGALMNTPAVGVDQPLAA